MLRRGVAALFVVYLLVVIWPLGTLFRGAEPFLWGLPFSLLWPLLWIVLGWIALIVLDRAEERAS
jgi:hypothetical protein